MQTLRHAFAASRFQAFAVRIGHDAVWLLIAALFFVVEAAVLLSELPVRASRLRSLRLSDRSPALTPAKAA